LAPSPARRVAKVFASNGELRGSVHHPDAVKVLREVGSLSR